MASSGIQFAVSKLSVNDRPSRMSGRIEELRLRNSRLVIDSAAISQDSTIVMPPASNVASDRAACAVVICTRSFPANGSFNIERAIVCRPTSVRDHRTIPTAATIKSGTNQIALCVIHPDKPNTITVTVGKLFPKPANKSDMRGTTNVVKKITMPRQANSRNVGYASAPRIFLRNPTDRRM